MSSWEPRRIHSASIGLLFLSSLYVLFRLLLIRHRFFDTDELEHLHAAWCTAHGQLIYRDFFEHHGPLLPFLLAPLTALVQDPIHAILCARLVILGFVLLTFRLHWQAVQSVYGGRLAWLSVIFMASFTQWSDKSLEVRPDVLAMALLSAALLLSLEDISARGDAFIGAALALAFLLTPKIIYPGGGLIAGLFWSRFQKKQSLFETFAPIVAGFLIPLAVTVAFFGANHAWQDFYRCFYLYNVKFRAFFPISRSLWVSLAQNPVLWGTSFIGSYLGRRHAQWLGFLAGAIIGLARLPIPYPQYYLFLAAPLSFFAIVFVSPFQERAIKSGGSRAWVLMGVTLVSLALPFSIQLKSLRQTNMGQIAAIRCVMDHTLPPDRIFDVWTGDSFYRPHAFYFWFLHDEVRAMLRPDWLEPKILQALEDPRCKGLIWGDYFNSLPPAVLALARRDFHDAGCGRLFLKN